MGLKEYRYEGSTWQFEDDQVPEGAVDIAAEAKALHEATEAAEHAAADKVAAQKAKQAPANKAAAAPDTK